jgi:putative tryptophan/tyrosine transport system substrate-binding protein
VKREVSGVRDSMNKKITVLSLFAMFFALCLSAEAQQTGRIYRVGYLSGSFPISDLGINSVKRELHNFGYVEGKNIAFEYRFAEDKPERIPPLADELVRLKVDVIIAAGSSDTRAAQNATRTIPIVFLESISDPVALGLVASLAHPGGNVTGFTTMATALAGKRLEVLKEAIPKLSSVAVLWNSQTRDSAPQWQESQHVASKVGLQLHSMDVRSADKYEIAFAEVVKAGSGALAVTRHRLSVSYHKRIIELAARHRLPAIYFREDFVENGGLMSYGADEIEPFKRAAAMVDKILKGAKPAELPVEQSTRLELIINLRAAKQIGLTIPPNVLARAEKVIR